MPTLTRYFIKSSLIHLIVSLVLGVIVAMQPLFAWSPELGSLRPVYLHLLIVGWIAQLIIGMMYWMFPKYSKTSPRGNTTLGWLVYFALNGGLLLRAIGEPLAAFRPEMNAGWLLVLSAVLLCGAGWGTVINTWTRVKER